MASASSLAASIIAATSLAGTPATPATPATVCALLTPFLQGPPAHFIEMRGVKTGDNAWEAKAMPEAAALGAKCTLTSYIKDRPDLDCVVRFDAGKAVEQDAFYRDAVTGFDYCLGNLAFGDSLRRVSERSDSPAMRVESLTWYRSANQNYREVAQFGGGVTKTEFKSSNSLQVKIELFYGENKP